MARHVALLTSNPLKVREWEKRLDLYGIEVHPHPVTASEAELLMHKKCIGVLREESNLFDPNTGKPLTAPFEDLTVALNRTTLEVFKEDTHHTYESEVEGYIDLSLKQTEGVFGWDDIFVPVQTQMSYHQMREKGLKLSARDKVISQFLMEHVWYSKLVNLNWDAQDLDKSVDFNLNPVDFIENHKFYSKLQGLPRQILNGVLKEGFFLRSAKNRREKVYWLPGLNAGIPLTPKRDSFHEATFMMHDFCHFAFPDLIFDGSVNPEDRRIYIMYRMMSEAFTLVLADMLFVDFWKSEGFDYDFKKRRIYPLYEEADDKALDKILEANARYCLLGDRKPYLNLGVSEETFTSFSDKFEQFFVSDYHWTAQNFENMKSKSHFIESWLQNLGDLPNQLGVPFQTVSDFKKVLTEEGTDLQDVEALFQAIFHHYLTRLQNLLSVDDDDKPLRDVCVSKGFLRYMMGQSAIFARFDFLQESKRYQDKIFSELRKEMDLDRIQKVRRFYEQYLSLLEDKDFISTSDKETYSQVFPLFDPYFVGYDTNTGETISEVKSLLLKV